MLFSARLVHRSYVKVGSDFPREFTAASTRGAVLSRSWTTCNIPQARNKYSSTQEPALEILKSLTQFEYKFLQMGGIGRPVENAGFEVAPGIQVKSKDLPSTKTPLSEPRIFLENVEGSLTSLTCSSRNRQKHTHRGLWHDRNKMMMTQ